MEKEKQMVTKVTNCGKCRCNGSCECNPGTVGCALVLRRLADIERREGTHHASIGDWIITGVNGEQYSCKPDMFAKTYIKCGQANKMEQIAAMFGKKLGEEFTVKYQTPKHKYVIQYHVSFEEKGLIVYGQNKDTILRQLLTGQAMIVND